MPGQGHGLQKDERIPRRLRTEGDSKDVFAMVKSYMSASTLIQPPLLVYPVAFQDSTEDYFNQINRTEEVVQQVLEPERSTELEALADAIEKDFPHMNRAARYYRSLIDAGRPRKPFARLHFLEGGPMAHARVPNVQLGERPPEPMNHWLQVVFHHSRGGA